MEQLEASFAAALAAERGAGGAGAPQPQPLADADVQRIDALSDGQEMRDPDRVPPGRRGARHRAPLPDRMHARSTPIAPPGRWSSSAAVLCMQMNDAPS